MCVHMRLGGWVGGYAGVLVYGEVRRGGEGVERGG